MGAESKIEWTDHTFNPWWGCNEVSPGCKNCYAKKLAARFGVGWGIRPPRRTFGEKHWNEPLAWNRKAKAAGVKARVFCASMGDVFEDHPTCDAERMKLWALIRATPNLMWLLLTKRPENIMPSLDSALARAREATGASEPGYHVARMLHLWVNGVPPKNVALGASIENQAAADVRVPALLGCPSAVRFLSMEPLLGGVTLKSEWMRESRRTHMRLDIAGAIRNRAFRGFEENGRELHPEVAEAKLRDMLAQGQRYMPLGACDAFSPLEGCPGHPLPRVDWVIVGGESGAGARPMHPDWARGLRDQCVEAGVAFFFKQWGEWAPADMLFEMGVAPGESRQPWGQCQPRMDRVGKKAAGRLLDGREWDEMPTTKEFCPQITQMGS